jgi:putative ABC transport system permease protein
LHGRSREFSLRTALGASRSRLSRQLSIESLSLAGAGGVLGVLAAAATVRLLIRLHPSNIPRLEETAIDGRVLLFAVAAALATVLLCGMFPAWSASRCDVNEVLKSSASRSVTGALSRLHRGLAIGQVALTFVLLTGSGLLIRSFLNLQGVDKGFRPASTASTSVQLDGRYEGADRRNAFFHDLVDRVAALPGVEAAAAASHLSARWRYRGILTTKKLCSNREMSPRAILQPWAFPHSKAGRSPMTMRLGVSR